MMGEYPELEPRPESCVHSGLPESGTGNGLIRLSPPPGPETPAQRGGWPRRRRVAVVMPPMTIRGFLATRIILRSVYIPRGLALGWLAVAKMGLTKTPCTGRLFWRSRLVRLWQDTVIKNRWRKRRRGRAGRSFSRT